MDFLSLCSKYVRQKWNGRVSCSVVSDSLWPHRLQPTRLRCPWNSPGKNIGVGSPIFSPRDPGIEPRSPASQAITGRFFTIWTALLPSFPIKQQLLFSCWVMSDSVTPCTAARQAPVLHHLPDFARTHVHWVGDAIQPSRALLPPLSSCSQSCPTSGSFPVTLLFTPGGQTIGASTSASVFPVNIPGLISFFLWKWYSQFSDKQTVAEKNSVFCATRATQGTRAGTQIQIQVCLASKTASEKVRKKTDSVHGIGASPLGNSLLALHAGAVQTHLC